MNFQDTIKAYLDNLAHNDAQFAEVYKKKGKSITDCCNYILRQASKQGQSVVISDDEVYGMAVHYYHEDIPAEECRPLANARATGKPTVELTESEKEKARQQAVKDYRKQMVAEMRHADKTRKDVEKKKNQERKEYFESRQLSLFD